MLLKLTTCTFGQSILTVYNYLDKKRGDDLPPTRTSESSIGSDDHGNGPFEATSLVQNEVASGSFTDHDDTDWFVWLADEPGAYKVGVIPQGDGKVRATIYSQDKD